MRVWALGPLGVRECSVAHEGKTEVRRWLRRNSFCHYVQEVIMCCQGCVGNALCSGLLAPGGGGKPRLGHVDLAASRQSLKHKAAAAVPSLRSMQINLNSPFQRCQGCLVARIRSACCTGALQACHSPQNASPRPLRLPGTGVTALTQRNESYMLSKQVMSACRPTAASQRKHMLAP